MLGFSAVKYNSGTYFSRQTDLEDPGYQIDLLFDREDHVITICEIMYIQAKVGVKVIEEMEKKLERFPNPKKKTIERGLITNNGVEASLEKRAYFDV